MKNKVDLLIKILFDSSASITERDDAAMYLAEFDDDKVINALVSISKNNKEDDMILNSSGEALGSIWVKRDAFDLHTYLSLSNIARYGIFYVIRSRKPEWIKKYHLDKDKFID